MFFFECRLLRCCSLFIDLIDVTSLVSSAFESMLLSLYYGLLFLFLNLILFFDDHFFYLLLYNLRLFLNHFYLFITILYIFSFGGFCWHFFSQSFLAFLESFTWVIPFSLFKKCGSFFSLFLMAWVCLFFIFLSLRSLSCISAA